MLLITFFLTIVYYSFFTLSSSFSFSQPRILKRWNSILKMSITNSAVISLNINVKNIAESTNFYTNVLGMKTLDSSTDQVCKLSMHTTSSNSKDSTTYPTIKLSTLSTKYQLGDAYQGLSVKLEDASKSFDKASQHGGVVKVAMDEYSYGASLQPDEDELVMFPVTYGRVTDPNGVPVEIVSSTGNEYPGMKVVLYVLNLEESIDFYTKALGMKLLRKRSNVNNRPREASLCAYLGYGQEKDDFCLELVYKYAVEKLDIGNVLEIGIGTSDMDALKTHIHSVDKSIAILEEGHLYMSLQDPNGYTCVREWRRDGKSVTKSTEQVRLCPLCRQQSHYVVPSTKPLSGDEKDRFLQTYKEMMASKPCKNLEDGECPFGSSCFYSHATLNSTSASIANRTIFNSNGESVLLSQRKQLLKDIIYED